MRYITNNDDKFNELMNRISESERALESAPGSEWFFLDRERSYTRISEEGNLTNWAMFALVVENAAGPRIAI